jgi:hypothetical protein
MGRCQSYRIILPPPTGRHLFHSGGAFRIETHFLKRTTYFKYGTNVIAQIETTKETHRIMLFYHMGHHMS